jgi:menaquinone-dependent protoporphyrinogen IX oxidase
MVKKTLIANFTRSGATKEVSEVIADTLKNRYNFEEELVDLRNSTANIQDSSNIIVGAGVHCGKVYGEALEFLKQDFGNKKWRSLCVAVEQVTLRTAKSRAQNTSLMGWLNTLT